MKRYFALFLIVFCLFSIASLFGCGDIGQPDSTTTTTMAYDSYFPLVSGRVITYEVLGVGTSEPIIETWKYDGYVNLTNNLQVFKIDVISRGETIPLYYREDSTGLYFYGYGSNPTSEAEIILRYPLSIGSSWDGLTVEAEEVVTTEAGSFLCKKITPASRIHLYSFDYWYAKNIGLIKQQYSGWEVPLGIISKEIISKNF